MQNTPKDPGAQTLQGAMTVAEQHFRAGRLAEAEAVLRDLVRRHPGNAEPVFALGLLAYSTRKLDAAIQLLEAAIEINPNDGRFHTNIAAMFGQRGNFGKAVEHGRIAVALQPNLSEPHNNLGVAYLNKGDTSSAIDEFSTAIALDRRNTDALCNRANCYVKTGRISEAEQDVNNALTVQGNNVTVLNALTSVLLAKHDHAEAEKAVRKALSLAPSDWHAMHNLILVLSGQKKFDDALMAANQAMQAFPTSAQARSLAGGIHLERRNFETALRLIEQSLAIDPDHIDAVVALAQYHYESSNLEKTIEIARRALDLDPAHSAALNLLGCALREQGHADEAIAVFERCLKSDPGNAIVYSNLAETKTFTALDDPHLVAMQALNARVAETDALAAIQLNFSLGKAFDDLGEPDRAFAHLSTACRLKRARSAYSEEETLNLFARIRREFTADVFSSLQNSGIASPLPIFIFGMPRSGSTLVEQILASHPMVKAGGELRHVHDALVELRARVAGHRAYPELLHDAQPRDLSLFGQSIVSRLAQKWPQSLRVTDKMPSNFFFLGLLRLALPGAKFIHTRRNAVDTCLSCYSKLFIGEINYTYDLGELGRYYRAYDQLMTHWRQVLPEGSFIDVQYEDLVGDTESVARKILGHCGLPWDPAVLDFHKLDRGVRTASALQVRRPVYSSSVARWKAYEKHLGPLLAELGDLAS